MQYKLVIVSGPTKNKEIVIEPPVVLGRSRDADIKLGHPLVSRRHCEIKAAEDGTLVVEDLGSLNGTYHGEERINEPIQLEPGELLTVGSVTFRAAYGKGSNGAAVAGAVQDSSEGLPDFSQVDPDEEEDNEIDALLADDDEDDDDFDFEEDRGSEAANQSPAAAAQDSEELEEVIPPADPAPGEQAEAPAMETDAEAPDPDAAAAETGESEGDDDLDWLGGEEAAASPSEPSEAADDDLDDFFKNI